MVGTSLNLVIGIPLKPVSQDILDDDAVRLIVSAHVPLITIQLASNRIMVRIKELLSYTTEGMGRSVSNLPTRATSDVLSQR